MFEITNYLDLTVLIAKLLIVYKIAEFLFAGIIVIVVLIFVTSIFCAVKDNKKENK